MLCEAAVVSTESFSINTSQLAYLFEYNPSYNYYHEPSSPVASDLLVIVSWVLEYLYHIAVIVNMGSLGQCLILSGAD